MNGVSVVKRICSFEGCGRPFSARNLCFTHAAQQRRGLQLTPIQDYSRRQRSKDAPGPGTGDWFFARVDEAPGDCWLWVGSRNSEGYGHFRLDGHFVKAHRWVYEYLRSEIPTGLVIDHLCRTRACVNPWHLEPVTARVNWSRGVAPTALNATKTHCDHGHEFTAENTAHRVEGGRKCRACKRSSSGPRAA